MGTYNTTRGQYEADGIEQIQERILEEYNRVFQTDFTLTQWQGTQDGNNSLIVSQLLGNLENDISRLGENFTAYIDENNLTLSTPSTTFNGIIDALVNEGYNASLRPINTIDDAGKSFIVVEDKKVEEGKEKKSLATDATERNKVAKIISDNLAYGIHTQGSLSGFVTLTNGQQIEVLFSTPVEKDLYIRATIKYTTTNPAPFQGEDEITRKILDNFERIYSIGNKVTPDKYLPITQVEFADDLVMEWSDDGEIYSGDIGDSLPSDYTTKRLLISDRVDVVLINTGEL